MLPFDVVFNYVLLHSDFNTMRRWSMNVRPLTLWVFWKYAKNNKKNPTIKINIPFYFTRAVGLSLRLQSNNSNISKKQRVKFCNLFRPKLRYKRREHLNYTRFIFINNSLTFIFIKFSTFRMVHRIHKCCDCAASMSVPKEIENDENDETTNCTPTHTRTHIWYLILLFAAITIIKLHL